MLGFAKSGLEFGPGVLAAATIEKYPMIASVETTGIHLLADFKWVNSRSTRSTPDCGAIPVREPGESARKMVFEGTSDVRPYGGKPLSGRPVGRASWKACKQQ